MNITDRINEKLADILTYICKNPSVFVSETDVHTLVAEALMEIPELSSKKLYDTKTTIGKNLQGVPSKENYKTMRVHKEYGHGEASRETEDEVKPGSRSDLVILGEDQIKTIDDPINLKSGGKWLIPEYIIEFGTEKCAGSKEVFEKHFLNDIGKTSRSLVRGYVIHIQRNYCQSTGDRLAQNRNKYEGYADVISRNTAAVATRPNLKVLVILVELGSAEGRGIFREGKIKIFKDSQFTGINANKVREEILAVIS